ncbi:MAG: phage integrase N-terminal SAM-like domain-containing protein [Candidatus Schekmanbacteria bacterium]|nr:phage integrase N-terminal SAM-like domain-containing protein [Candidatus Schekmanbacteria bacterium]
MTEAGDPLGAVLDGYASFLRQRQLAPPQQQSFLVRWVRELLRFARQQRGYTFERTLDAFLAEVGNRVGTEPWQVRQSADAVRIYRYQYRAAREPGQSSAPELTNDAVPADDQDLLQRLREVIRLRHYVRATEKAYLDWSRRFLEYRGQTGLAGEPTAADLQAFLTRLAMVQKVSASTQNQAFSALLLLFREVLRMDLAEMARTVRAKRGRRLPTVFSLAEVKALLAAVKSEYQLMVRFPYGTVLRLMDLLRLRVKDLDFDAGLVVVRGGKGDRDRTTLLPASFRQICRDTWRKCVHGTKRIWREAARGRRHPRRWRGSTRTLGGNGVGSPLDSL